MLPGKQAPAVKTRRHRLSGQQVRSATDGQLRSLHTVIANFGANGGPTPPAWRNHRVPTACDTPIPTAASSELIPLGDRCPEPNPILTPRDCWPSRRRHLTLIQPNRPLLPPNTHVNTSAIEVLRRSVESTQFRSRKFTRALHRHGLVGSMGQVGRPLTTQTWNHFSPCCRTTSSTAATGSPVKICESRS